MERAIYVTVAEKSLWRENNTVTFEAQCQKCHSDKNITDVFLQLWYFYSSCISVTVTILTLLYYYHT
jgi:hypothetical protein